MKDLLKALGIIALISLAVGNNQQPIPIFRMGQEEFRQELVTYDCNQLNYYCRQIYSFIQNYDYAWDIMGQLLLDKKYCDYHLKIHPLHTFQHMHFLEHVLPIVQIEGILPFGTNTSKVRKEDLFRLSDRDFIAHCSLTEHYILNYEIVFYAWEQLSLDYEVCLDSYLYGRKAAGRQKFLKIVSNIRSNNTILHIDWSDLVYVYNSSQPRHSVLKFSDLKLNYFCNRILYLYDNYNQSWGIWPQLRQDIVTCYLAMRSRSNFTRQFFSVSTSEPNVVVNGVLGYVKGVAVNRQYDLENMHIYNLRKHCNITGKLLEEYKPIWRIFDQLSYDGNICNILIHSKHDILEHDTRIDNRVWSTIPINVTAEIQLCATIGNKIMHEWNMKLTENILLTSLKKCMFQLKSFVLCSNPKLDTSTGDYEDDALLLKSTNLTIKTWKQIRMLNKLELYDLCVHTVLTIQHHLSKPEEDMILLKRFEICMQLLQLETANTTTRKYYLLYNTLVPVEGDVVTCNNTISTILKIMFPMSFIDELYLARGDTTRQENISANSWDYLEIDAYQSTNICNNNSIPINQPTLQIACDETGLEYNKTSVDDFCNEASVWGKHLDSLEKIRILNKLKICIILRYCWGACEKRYLRRKIGLSNGSQVDRICYTNLELLLSERTEEPFNENVDLILQRVLHCPEVTSSMDEYDELIGNPNKPIPFFFPLIPLIPVIFGLPSFDLPDIDMDGGDENFSAESSKEDSEDSSEEESSKEKTTTTPQSTTTEETTTTTDSPPLCWLDPLLPTISKGRSARSPSDPKLLPTEKYPKSPLGKCRLVINEINAFSKNKESYEFIELVKECDSGGRMNFAIGQSHLQNYIVVIINGYSRSIVFYANLKKARQENTGGKIFITIGPENKAEVTLPFTAEGMHISRRAEGNVLPPGWNVANMVMLLYIPNQSAHSKLQPHDLAVIEVKDIVQGLLTTHRQDCLVYASTAYKDKCEIFENICPELNYQDRDYVLRDVEVNNDDTFEDLSLSRCVTHSRPMDVWGFKLSEPTPSKENECAKGVRFIVSENVDVLPLRDSRGIEDLDDERNEAPHCSSSVPERQLRELDSVEFRKGVKRKHDAVVRDCMEGDLQNSKLSGIIQEVKSLDDLISQKTHSNGIWFEKGCSVELKQHLEYYMSDKVDVSICDDSTIGWWLELTPNEDESNRHFKCAICNEFYKDFYGPTVSKRTELMSDDGFLYTSSRARVINTNTIRTHAKSLVHLDAVDYVKDKILKRSREEVKNVIRSNVPPRDRLTRPTENIFYQVMFSVIHGYPSSHFEDEINFNANYYAEYGSNHKTIKGYNKITSFVANEYYKDLLTEIAKQQPLSIVLDGYRDSSGRNMIAVSLMMFYKNKLSLKYFFVFAMGSDHTSEAQFKGFMETLKNAPMNVELSLLSSLVYFVADGASTNSGKFNSILTKLREKTGRTINFFHCASHRLHLVFTKVLKPTGIEQVGIVVKSVEKVARFFDTRSNKLARLIEVQKETRNGKPPVVPHRPHPVRWASSLRLGFNKIFVLYDSILNVIEELISDNRKPKKQKEEAIALRTLITSKDYLTWLAFLTDVLDVFAGFSQKTQEKLYVLVDHVELRSKIKKEINELENDYGQSLKKLLREASCGTSDVTGCNSLEYFERFGTSYKSAIINGDESSQDHRQLSRYRSMYIALILGEIEKQFPDKYKMYEILNPKNFPIPSDVNRQYTDEHKSSPPADFQYGENDVRNILKDIALVIEGNFYEEWRELMWSILSDANFPAIRDMTPSLFWQSVLDRQYLGISDNMERFIKSFLVIPASSADIERIFSSVTYLIGGYRFRTSVAMLNDYLRLRHELPRPISNWQAYPYVVKFVEKGHALSLEGEGSERVGVLDADELDEELEWVCEDEESNCPL